MNNNYLVVLIGLANILSSHFSLTFSTNKQWSVRRSHAAHRPRSSSRFSSRMTATDCIILAHNEPEQHLLRGIFEYVKQIKWQRESI